MLCNICNHEYNGIKGLSMHIVQNHKLSIKTYYDTYLRNDHEDNCRVCGKTTTFSGLRGGYYPYCSTRCSSNDILSKEKYILTCQKKYGVDNIFSLQETKDKIKRTNLVIYGCDNPSKSEEIKQKIKQKNILRWGVDNPFKSDDFKLLSRQTNLKNFGYINVSQSEDIKKKKKITSQVHYGTDYPSQCEEIKIKKEITNYSVRGVKYPIQCKEIQEKIKTTNLKRFGVENPSQCKSIRDKIIKSCFRRKEYILPSGLIVYLQGEEPQFLDHVFFHNILQEDDIVIYPNKIRYLDKNNKKHYYFPDFLITKYNLIVEIKSSYILENFDHNISEKKQSVLDSKFRYILIIDKNYFEFDELVKVVGL